MAKYSSWPGRPLHAAQLKVARSRDLATSLVGIGEGREVVPGHFHWVLRPLSDRRGMNSRSVSARVAA